MSSQRILARVRGLLSDLSATEQALADVLLREPEAVLGMSVAAWAQRGGVSTASVVRFCRSLGFSGLKDFRVALAIELHEQRPGVHSGEVAEKLAEQVIEANIQALRETRQLLDLHALEKAAQLLLHAATTEFFALGLSSPIALDAVCRLQRLGLSAAYSPDTHMQAVKAAGLPLGGVAFAISHSGRAPEVVAAAQHVRSRGIRVIALTSSPRSPLAAQADLALIAATSEARSQAEARSSRIAHLAIVDTLCATILQLSPDGAGAALARTREAERALLR